MIIDGILRADAYGAMLGALHRDHRGLSRFYYLDVPFEETMRRHATRPQAAEFGRPEMSCWYRERDLLPGGIEQAVRRELAKDTVRHVSRSRFPARHAARQSAMKPPAPVMPRTRPTRRSGESRPEAPLALHRRAPSRSPG